MVVQLPSPSTTAVFRFEPSHALGQKMKHVLLVVALVLVVTAAANATLVNGLGEVRNARPIVGVMAQPTYADPQYKGLGRTYLAAAYVKWSVPPSPPLPLFSFWGASFSFFALPNPGGGGLTGLRVQALAWSPCSTEPISIVVVGGGCVVVETPSSM